jgi:hypothetical protein
MKAVSWTTATFGLPQLMKSRSLKVISCDEKQSEKIRAVNGGRGEHPRLEIPVIAGSFSNVVTVTKIFLLKRFDCDCFKIVRH